MMDLKKLVTLTPEAAAQYAAKLERRVGEPKFEAKREHYQRQLTQLRNLPKLMPYLTGEKEIR